MKTRRLIEKYLVIKMVPSGAILMKCVGFSRIISRGSIRTLLFALLESTRELDPIDFLIFDLRLICRYT